MCLKLVKTAPGVTPRAMVMSRWSLAGTKEVATKRHPGRLLEGLGKMAPGKTTIAEAVGIPGVNMPATQLEIMTKMPLGIASQSVVVLAKIDTMMPVAGEATAEPTIGVAAVEVAVALRLRAVIAHAA
mmetsp:Transcript_106847/g.312332  ORF Transcript_106847/g.312332 Transcript_106847/m.312332 type:complete len:128 (+) Transcript_106847:287-670(+)